MLVTTKGDQGNNQSWSKSDWNKRVASRAEQMMEQTRNDIKEEKAELEKHEASEIYEIEIEKSKRTPCDHQFNG